MTYDRKLPISEDNPIPIKSVSGSYSRLLPVSEDNPYPVMLVTGASYSRFEKVSESNPWPTDAGSGTYSRLNHIADDNPFPVVIIAGQSYDPNYPVSGTNPFPIMSAGIVAPVLESGPTWTDNGNGTSTIDPATTDIETYLGIDAGLVSGVYTQSAFDYDGAGPALLLSLTHDFDFPDALAGGTAFGLWYWRVWAGTPAGFSGYISTEQNSSIAPVLSNATDGTPTADGTDDATVDTNCGTGTLYWCLVTNGGSATAAQIKAGTGGNIVAGTAGNQAVSGTGTQAFDVTGAAGGTLYQIKTLHNVSGADSAQGSVNLTTAASGPPVTDRYAWYKFNTGITETGTGVSAWADNDASGRNVVQTDDGKRPTKETDGSITFNGTSDGLNASFTLAQPYVTYIKYKSLSWTSTDRILDGPVNRASLQQTGTDPDIQLNAGAGNVGTLEVDDDGNYHIVRIVWNGASSVLEVDGTGAETVNPGTNAPGGISIGSNGLVTGQYANIQVLEVIVYNNTQSGGDTAATLAYLATVTP